MKVFYELIQGVLLGLKYLRPTPPVLKFSYLAKVNLAQNQTHTTTIHMKLSLSLSRLATMD